MLANIPRVHLWYWIGILVALLVATASTNLASNKEIANVLSFALTFASLLLAVIAIVQAFFNNASSAQTLTAVQSPAEELRRGSQEIHAGATQLRRDIEAIPARLDLMSGELRQTTERLSALTAPIARTSEESVQGGDPNSQREARQSRSEITSVGAFVAWYLMKRAYEEKVAVEPRQIFGETRQGGFIEGWIRATITAGLVKGKSPPGQPAIMVEELDPYISKDLEERVERSRIQGKNRYMLQLVDRVERHLSELPSHELKDV